MSEIGRNDPCPCGSGKKYKKCCGNAAAKQDASGQTAKSADHNVNATNVAPPSERLLEAVALHQAGQLDEAKAAYQSLLKDNSDNSDALHYLGMIASQKGDYQDAIDLIESAIKINRMVPAFHCNLGNAYKRSGQFDSAVTAFQEAVRLDPEFQVAYSNLGNIFLGLGRLDEATTCYKQALLLGPDFAEAHYNLGNALDAQGKTDAAAESYRKALALKPDYAEAHNNLGNTLNKQGKFAEAVSRYRQALKLKPDYAEAHYNLGNVLKNQGRLDEAATCCQKALALKPDFIDAHITLGCVLMDQGKFNAAIGNFRKALSIKPDHAHAYSNLLFLYAFHALLDPQEYLAQARGWERACLTAQERQAAHGRVFRRPPPAGRRLKVGYVSADYHHHPVSFNMEQVFAHHDRSRIELFAYSNDWERDAVTERLQSLVEHWVPVVGVADAAARDRIEADGIDVLIDLSGHTAHNRMGVFALRAAPVQAYYLGYFASTGLTEMDYLIGDGVLTPPETDNHFSEQVWRLPRTWQVYNGKADLPVPDWQPGRGGTVWMGSFNNLSKLTPATLALWAKTLHALPEAKLLLKTKELADAGNRRRILDTLSGHGIAPERIELQHRSATPDWPSHMAYYGRLDIALDPAGGMGGGITTCDALWMGVPVITLEGDRYASRITATLLDALGRPEWIARSETEYVDKVVALAKNVEQRKALRPAQRGRMAHSPLCDARGLAACLENAYFEMFERWMERQK